MFILNPPTRLLSITRRAIVWMVLVCMCLPVSGVFGQDVLIILSSQAKPYIDAAQACESRLDQEGITSKRMQISTVSTAYIKEITTDVITIGGRASAKLARDLPAQIHLYYCMAPDPDLIGLTQRLDTSGISTETDLTEQLKLIEAGSSTIKRIGMLYRSSSANSAASIDQIKAVIPSDMQIVAVDLDKAKSESQGIKDLLSQHIDIVWTLPDPSAYNSSMIKSLLLESIRKEIPVFGFSHSLVKAGATFGVGIDPKKQGTRVADFVIDHIVDTHLSAEPGIAINLIAADRIGVRFSEQFIKQADVIFREN